MDVDNEFVPRITDFLPSGIAGPLVQTAHFALQSAAAGAQFAPIPLLPTAILFVDQVITLCQNVKVNKQAAKALQERCKALHKILLEVDPLKETEVMRNQLVGLMKKLTIIREQMEVWAQYGKVKSFFLQAEIMGEIQQSRTDIDNYLQMFQVASHNDIRAVVHRIEAVVTQKEDKLEKKRVRFDEVQARKREGSLEDADKKFIHDEVAKVGAEMETIRKQLSGMKVDDPKREILQATLLNIQAKSKCLLPEVQLKAGEVERVGTRPIGGTAEFDIWEGKYLGQQRCTLRVLRSTSFNERQRDRLVREVKIWRKIWEQDQGEYIVPFLGICLFDGPYPYLVSPWMENGDALTYIRKNPETNRKRLIYRIAQGLLLLHSQNPPIAHGDLKASKVYIDDSGNPLLADFGLSKIIENVTGVPFTQTNVVSDQYRWFAPEVCMDAYVLVTASDIFSFAMTVLELMTGKSPFSQIKRTPEVLLKIQRGERPSRPSDEDVIERGLDDRMWALMQRCWAQKPEDRPNIHEVIAELPQS